MGVTNFERNILTMVHLMKYHSDGGKNKCLL